MRAAIIPRYTAPSADLRQKEAEKTSRLRALRLAKEAADREATMPPAAVDLPNAGPSSPGPPKRVRRKQPGPAPAEH